MPVTTTLSAFGAGMLALPAPCDTTAALRAALPDAGGAAVPAAVAGAATVGLACAAA
ncbi:hypothetical protein [Tanticharoenia sakaeratensis]|uniref:hypothetical protein n=1 Tax=Tanticharoenia sakaeratensis TaxID=444053 RepID=UPI001F527BCA|nr:hypothetical protein [Tanticharoenia sakaeratensis]